MNIYVKIYWFQFVTCESVRTLRALTYTMGPAGQIQTSDGGRSEGNQTGCSSCLAFLDFQSDNLKEERNKDAVSRSLLWGHGCKMGEKSSQNCFIVVMSTAATTNTNNIYNNTFF